MSSSQVIRLHISPLTPDLLPTVLGPQLTKIVRNISYHSVQTFPDQPYGYVDLPAMEAEKVKKKLHGAILKGKKLKIEDARPRKRKHADGGNEEQVEQVAGVSRPKEAKKSKTNRDVVQGQELSTDRKVKRGWTEQKTSRKKATQDGTMQDRPTSKYRNTEELLFRAKLPDNKAEMGTSRKKKSKSSNRSQTVHEFEKSTVQPSFLKTEVNDASTPSQEYVEGKGWIDADGNLVEPEPSNLRERRKARKAESALQDIERVATNESVRSQTGEHTSEDDQISNEEETEVSEESTPGSSSSAQSSEAPSSSEEPQLHPLEALFKKPQKPASSQDVAKPSLEVQTAFSIFGRMADDDIEDDPSMPGTPSSSQDVRSRGLRSAAPTPDTAHPSRFNSYGSSGLPGDEEMESGEEDGDQDDQGARRDKRSPAPNASGLDVQQSDFAKMFWEKRGENNRSWKARRRTVLKEKRQRENRARRPKNW